MALWGKTDADASRPKYLNSDFLPKAIFVDETEAQQKSNHDRGLNGAGWWLYNTYTDADGNTRYKTELLVAITESAANAGDRADDTKAADAAYTISISSQPANQNTSSGGATFSVTASVTAGGGTLAYQWQKKAVASGSRWTNIPDATAATYNTADTLVDADDGTQFRVIVGSTSGAVKVTSDVATAKLD